MVDSRTDVILANLVAATTSHQQQPSELLLQQQQERRQRRVKPRGASTRQLSQPMPLVDSAVAPSTMRSPGLTRLLSCLVGVALVLNTAVEAKKFRELPDKRVCLLADFNITVVVRPSDSRYPSERFLVLPEGTRHGGAKCQDKPYSRYSTWSYYGQNGSLSVVFDVSYYNQLSLQLFYETRKHPSDQKQLRGSTKYHRLEVELPLAQLTEGFAFLCRHWPSQSVVDAVYNGDIKTTLGQFDVDIDFVHIDNRDMIFEGEKFDETFNPKTSYCSRTRLANVLDSLLTVEASIYLAAASVSALLATAFCCWWCCRSPNSESSLEVKRQARRITPAQYSNLVKREEKKKLKEKKKNEKKSQKRVKIEQATDCNENTSPKLALGDDEDQRLNIGKDNRPLMEHHLVITRV